MLHIRKPFGLIWSRSRSSLAMSGQHDGMTVAMLLILCFSYLTIPSLIVDIRSLSSK